MHCVGISNGIKNAQSTLQNQTSIFNFFSKDVGAHLLVVFSKDLGPMLDLGFSNYKTRCMIKIFM